MRRAQKRENSFYHQVAEKRSRTAPLDSRSGASSSSYVPNTPSPRVGMGTPERRICRRDMRRSRRMARRTTIANEVVVVP